MALGRKSGQTTSSAPSIHVIAHDRMADRREMNADLVSPSGMEMGTKKVPRIEPSKAYDVGLGRPTLIDDCHALPVSWIAGDRLVDREGVRGQVTPDHDRVTLVDPGDFDPHQLALLRSVAGLLAPAVDEDVSLRNKSRRLRPRKLSTVGNKEIEADIAVRLDGKLPDVAQRLALRRIVRYGCGGNDGRCCPLLPPQHPGEEKRADADGHVRDVEGWPAQIA